MKRLTTIFCCLFFAFVTAQNQYSSVNKALEEENYYQADLEIEKLAKRNPQIKKTVDYNVKKALISTALSNTSQSLFYWIEAKKLYQAAGNKSKAIDINFKIVNLLSSGKNTKQSYKTYLEEVRKFAQETNNDTLKIKLLLQDGIAALDNGLYADAEKLNLIAREKAIKFKKLNFQLTAENNLSAIYNNVLNQPTKALKLLKESERLLENSNNRTDLAYNYINQAGSFFFLTKYDSALVYLDKAAYCSNKTLRRGFGSIIYDIKSLVYDSLGNKAKALEFLKLKNQVEDSLQLVKQNNAIAYYDARYLTKEKELKIVTLESERKSYIAIIAFLGLFALVAILSVFIIRNRRKIKEQKQLIEFQKLEQKLKDRELREIDLILESQEKERKLIAEELHDDLGNTLTALRINFEDYASDNQKPDQKATKVAEIIASAYTKIREISHVKQKSIVGQSGLLVAVQAMAAQLTVSGTFNCEVFPHNLKTPINNSVELLIFRIIQELCTNAIKHAKATNLNIYLSQDDAQLLTLMVEDNGVGFDGDISALNPTSGLRNIESKIETMGGSFTVDSYPGRGTTVIITTQL